MSMIKWYRNKVKLLLVALLFVIDSLQSAPPRSYYVEDPVTTALKDMRGGLDGVRHEVNNHEVEIRTFDEKLRNLDSIIESVRDQLNDSVKFQKESLKGSSNTLETKITALETASKGLLSDIRQFKTHANETSTALLQYKQKIDEIEKIVQQQNQNIDNMQAALKALMDAIQIKDAPLPKKTSDAVSGAFDGPTYRVKAGDSLEKIAKNHQVSVQSLKELNGLVNDKIVVGKVLQIPEK